MKKQPSPKKNKSKPIVDLVVKDMKDRKKLGLKRYKTYLQAHNGRDGLQDLYEELLDACMYIKQVIEERESPTCSECDYKFLKQFVKKQGSKK